MDRGRGPSGEPAHQAEDLTGRAVRRQRREVQRELRDVVRSLEPLARALADRAATSSSVPPPKTVIASV